MVFGFKIFFFGLLSQIKDVSNVKSIANCVNKKKVYVIDFTIVMFWGENKQGFVLGNDPCGRAYGFQFLIMNYLSNTSIIIS